MKNTLILLALCLPALAIAENPDFPQPIVGAHAAAIAAQMQGQVQGQKQTSIVGVTAAQRTTQNTEVGQTNQQGNVQNIIFEGSTERVVKQVNNTPDPYTGNVYPTATCMGGTSASATGPGVGISFGTSYVAKECIIGEVSRGFEQAGYKEDALVIRCQSEYAAVAPICKKLKQEGKPVIPEKVQPVTTDSIYLG